MLDRKALWHKTSGQLAPVYNIPSPEVANLGFEVGDARDEVIRELQEMGFDTGRTIGIYPGSSWTIVDSEDVLGVNLNIKPKR